MYRCYGTLVHNLTELPPTIALADFVEQLKSNTSSWIKQLYPSFYWQGGYTALTVSRFDVGRVRRYIQQQEQHHGKMSYQEELKKLLAVTGLRMERK